MNSKPVVLIVDDTATNLQLLAQLLKDEYHLKVANSGQKALDLAELEPDLILLDIIMPDMDGYEVCRRLKENEKTKSIPVIFLTGKSEEEDEKYGLSIGAVDYITKPFHASIVAARIKTHITLSQQYQQLQFMAMHDQLTGLHNRHFLLDVASKKLSAAKRHGYPLSMMIMDIDHFKKINDQYGHVAGDAVLSEVAGVVRKYCRNEDVAARMGGEEFVLMLEYCSVEDCKQKAEYLRKEIEVLMPQDIKVTASFGVTQYADSDDEFKTFYGRVDAALYAAKENGRNRVEQG